MASAERVHLTIEIQQGGSAPAGRLFAGGEEVGFEGWLQLLGALRAAIAPEESETSVP